MEISSTINIQSLQNLYEKEKNEKEELRTEVMKLQLQLHKLTQIVFGSKSERFVVNTGQLRLDIQTEEAAPACKIADTKKVQYIKTDMPKKRDLSELSVYMQYLDRVEETREPETVPEGAIKIGEEKHESIETTPGRTFVRVVVIPKYKFVSDGKTGIISAAAPERPLAKCMAGSSLLAQILVGKFCDHLPLHRQMKRFERNGVSIPYNTFIDWTGKSIELLSVMGQALLKEIIESSYIHVDETGLKVLLGKESTKEKKIHGGYLWCYKNSIKNLVYFNYQAGLGEKHTIGILKKFTGVIQTDG